MKKSKFIVLSAFAFISISCIGLVPFALAENVQTTDEQQTTIKGYIIDEDCFNAREDMSNHPKSCLKMNSCAGSGYGIAVLQNDGTYSFYYFDGDFAPNATATQELAYNLIVNSNKDDHISVSVTGIINGTQTSKDGTSYPLITASDLMEDEIQITTLPQETLSSNNSLATITTNISQASTSMPQDGNKSQTFTGYIIDEDCFNTDKDMSNHPRSCLEMESCASSGYGIAIKKDDGTYDFYYFDGDFAPNATGSQVLAKNLIDDTEKSDHISIKVIGYLSGNKMSSDGNSFPVIHVDSLIENISKNNSSTTLSSAKSAVNNSTITVELNPKTSQRNIPFSIIYVVIILAASLLIVLKKNIRQIN